MGMKKNGIMLEAGMGVRMSGTLEGLSGGLQLLTDKFMNEGL